MEAHTIIRHNGIIFLKLASLLGERKQGLQGRGQWGGHCRGVSG